MNYQPVTAGFLATVIALIVGVTFGTLGGWEPILAQVETPLGGWILAIFLGIVLTQIYTKFGFSQFLPGDNLTKGALFGFLVWVAILIVGSFWTPINLAVFTAPFASIILHLIWGTTLAFFLQNLPK